MIANKLLFLFSVVFFMYAATLSLKGMLKELTKETFFCISFCFSCVVLFLIIIAGFSTGLI